MAFLDTFTLVDEPKNRPFITLRNTTITFSKSSVECLDYSKFIHMFIDTKNHRVAFQACNEDGSAIEFYAPPKDGRQMLIRISSKSKARMIMNLHNIEDCGKGIRIYGDYLPEEKVLVFNLDENDKNKS